MWNATFDLTLRECVIFIMLFSFCVLDVYCDELNNCAWNLGLYQLSNLCVYVYWVESFAHIERYSDCSHRESHLVEPFCYGIV